METANRFHFHFHFTFHVKRNFTFSSECEESCERMLPPSSDTLTLTTCTGVGSQAAAKMKEAGDIGLAELMCTLDLYESHGMLWANTVPMVG